MSTDIEKWAAATAATRTARDTNKRLHGELGSARAAIDHLRETAKIVLSHKTPQHAPNCHCYFCLTAHALSATSGYEPNTQGAKNGESKEP